MWNLKNNTNESLYNTETDTENKSMVTERERENGERTDQEYGTHRLKTSIHEWIRNKDSLHRTGDYTPYLTTIDNGIIQYAKKNHYAVCLQLIQYCKSIILQ